VLGGYVFLQKEVNFLKKLVPEAGLLLQSLKNEGVNTQKEDSSPVTIADLACDELLKKELSRFSPEIGWLSEETADDGERFKKQYTWIVDPLDGTKEYIKNIPEYAISIALVEDGLPVLAVVYNPHTLELFHAVKGEGAWLNDQLISCSTSVLEQPSVLASCTEYSKGHFDSLKSSFNITPTGSIAYRLALVASGVADATYTLNNRCEWDIAAGVLLIQEAGGVVHDLAGQLFTFNQEDTRVNGVIASSKVTYRDVMDKIG
jgi:myo-inositol-1(or 4)-monophosphatase